MTAAVIGIALALPSAFFLLLANVQTVTGQWQSGAQLSLFLKRDTSASQYQQMAREIGQRPGVSNVRVVTPEQALDEFKRSSGFTEALQLLDENPLPPVLIVDPVGGQAPGALEKLADELRALPAVETARLDMQWVKRLHSIMRLVERGVWVVALLLAGAVMLVVGNTIRLDIENRRDEIVISKLIGATDSFVRRPFLYEGLWYGAVGALMAALLIEIARLVLDGPLDRLSALYGNSLGVQGLGISGLSLLLLSGALLGLIGSWMAVGRHLAALEPS